MSAQKPSLLRVLSDSWRIISSNALHFLALSSLFIFPTLVFRIIHALTSPLPSSPPPLHPVSNSTYGQLLSLQNSEVPSMDKSQIISQLLYSLPIYLLSLCFIVSTTSSIFHGFHSKPLKLSSSLRSIVSSFFPLLVTKIACLVVVAVIVFGFAFLIGLSFFGLALLGFTIEPETIHPMVVGFVSTAVLMVGTIFLQVELILMDASAVVESKWGFSAIGRSSSLVKGARGVAFRIVVLFWGLYAMLLALYSMLPGRSGGGGFGAGVAEMVVEAAVFTSLWVLSLATHTVLFVYCKGEAEAALPTTDQKVQGQVYIQLPQDAELGHL